MPWKQSSSGVCQETLSIDFMSMWNLCSFFVYSNYRKKMIHAASP